MLLSDRELKAALADGRLRLDPLEASMVQPASIDVRLDRYFRVFANHRYTHIDPATEQDDLTEVVEPKGDEPFVLHPGEFVLGSTLEVISLADDLASRLEGKALACDTPIWTPVGRTTMGELAPGDHVFDERGRPTRVVAVSEVMLGRPCYEVITGDGHAIVADASHRWLTATNDHHERICTTAEVAQSVRDANGRPNHRARGAEREGVVQFVEGGAVATRAALRTHVIVEVRPVASVPVRCIEVENPRGMFLAGDECIPTHNSSLGRLGLLTHSTAGFIDPGFSGHVTLELSNVANLPITLWPGMKIGQICVFQLSSPAEHPYGSSVYGSRYQDQRGPTPSRSYKSFHRTDVPPAT